MELSYLKPDSLPEFIILIIQYADEKDVETFLKNCSINTFAKSTKPYETISKTYNKEALIFFLLNLGVILSKYKTNNSTYEDNIQNLQVGDVYKNLLFHLLALNGCTYSYDPDMVIKNFTEVFHILVESFAKYHFYYDFFNDRLITTYCDSKRKLYTIEYQKRKTILTEEDNNNKIILNTCLKKMHNVFGNDYLCIETQTIGYFRKINSLLYEKLKVISQPDFCVWCNPSNIKNAKRKCNNCKNLAEELKELQKKTDVKKIKQINFTEHLSKISPTDLKELKIKRKKYLKEIIKEAKLDKTEHKMFLKNLNSIINKSFKI